MTEFKQLTHVQTLIALLFFLLSLPLLPPHLRKFTYYKRSIQKFPKSCVPFSELPKQLESCFVHCP